MGVAFGSPVTSANSNAAWISKNTSDTAVGVYTLANVLTASGATINNLQAAVNATLIATGASESNFATGVTYGAPTNTIVDGTSHVAALLALAKKFDPSTGHMHTGAAGDGPPIGASSIASVPLKGYIIQGTDLAGVTGGTSNVSTQLSGVPVSSGVAVLGAVVTAPQNKIIVRNSTNDAEYVDGLGNLVYARLTNSGGPTGTWTLTYYSEVSGTETPYSFAFSSGVRWYYQQLFNPLNGAPTYSEFATVPSDNATADVIVATSSQYGKVLLSSASPPAVGASGSAGTANGIVANADHTHAGLTGFQLTTGRFTLTNNTPSPTSFISIAASGLSGLAVTYGITRNAGESRHGTFFVSSDGSTSTVQYEDGSSAEQTDPGVALSSDINAGFFRLLYTTTNTGHDATINVEVKSIPN